MTWSPSPWTQQAVVDEDAGEPIADGPMQQRGDDGRVDAAGQAEQTWSVADLLAHAGDRVVDDVARRPQVAAAADLAVAEALEDAPPWWVWVTSGWNCTP
jgi:hypothetical protein